MEKFKTTMPDGTVIEYVGFHLGVDDPLHPTGKCRCAGEGKCEWCTTPTICGCTNATCGGCGDGDDPDDEVGQVEHGQASNHFNSVGDCESDFGDDFAAEDEPDNEVTQMTIGKYNPEDVRIVVDDQAMRLPVSGDYIEIKAAQLEVALTFAAPAVAVLDRAEDALARLRYPLYCVDRGEMFNDAQFVGPYASHEEAQQHAGPDDLIARCRRLRPSEIAYTYDAAECWPNPQATADALNVAVVRDGEIPEAAWYAWHDRVVHVEIDDDTYPTEANFKQWVDEHLRADVYICEGDE